MMMMSFHFFVLLHFIFVGDIIICSPISTRTNLPTHHQLLHSTKTAHHNFPRQERELSIPHSSNDNIENSIYMNHLSSKIHVPIISTHATISSCPQLPKCPHSFSSEIEAMVDIVRGFQWHEIIFLHQDSEPSNQFASQLVDTFRDKEILISNKIYISSSITYFNTLKILTKISKTQTRIILVDATDVTLGTRLVVAAKEVGLMSKGYAWLITSRMTTMLNSMDQYTLNVMEGALGIRPNMENIPRGHSGNSINPDLLQRDFVMSFEVFNILGKVERVVAIWSPHFGFSRDLGIIIDNDAKRTNSVNNFKKIIWPGDSTMAPRSCDVPRTIRTRGPWRGI